MKRWEDIIEVDPRQVNWIEQAQDGVVAISVQSPPSLSREFARGTLLDCCLVHSYSQGFSVDNKCNKKGQAGFSASCGLTMAEGVVTIQWKYTCKPQDADNDVKYAL
jgi:hypothetical protein